MKKLFVCITLGTLLLTSCDKSNYVTYSGLAQGTTYKVVVDLPGESLGDRIDDIFAEMDGTFSMFSPESLVSRINRNETDETTPLFDEIFTLAEQVYRHSGGYYDITVKPLVDAWGFGPGQEEEAPCIECIMEYVGMDKIRLSGGRVVKDDPRVQLDFSSIAKGATVDLIAGMLERAGAADYIVEIGGEVRAKGKNASGNPWRIGINKPVEGFYHELQGVVVFEGSLKAIATSGNYRNWFMDEHGRRRVHTIDAKTGQPAIGNILSVSIAAPECAAADAYATGLMAAGDIDRARVILPPDGIEYFVIYTDDRGETAVLRSPGFPLKEE